MGSTAAERGQSTAVELKKRPPWPMDLSMFMTEMFLGGLGFLRLLNVLDSRMLIILADLCHALGVFSLGITLIQDKNCAAGLSLKSLQLTFLHLAVKMYYGFLVESYVFAYDVFSLVGTLVAIFMVGFVNKSSYVDNQDNFKMLYLLIPCALLSLVIHPTTLDNMWRGIIVAFGHYLNSISMLPQLQLMRRREVVRPYTAKYILWLGCERLLHVENWIIEILLTQGQSVTSMGYNNIWWAVMGVLSEIVNGFILVDYCYYYMFTDFDGDREDLHLPSGVV